LSNAQRIFTEYELRMLDIAKYFDGMLISSDYGVKKTGSAFLQSSSGKISLESKGVYYDRQ
jgi:putative hydrolase of the HAD superfamily